jgi:hypothetical protein
LPISVAQYSSQADRRDPNFRDHLARPRGGRHHTPALHASFQEQQFQASEDDLQDANRVP